MPGPTPPTRRPTGADRSATSLTSISTARKWASTCRELAPTSRGCTATNVRPSATSMLSTKTLSRRTHMDRVVRAAVSSFERVHEFLTQHPLSDAPATFGVQSTELDDVIARLSGDSLDQEAGSRFVRAHTESQRKLRSTLYNGHMHPLSRVARDVFGVSGMDKAFRMPKTGAANQTLLASAGAMAEVAEKEKDELLKHGLP